MKTDISLQLLLQRCGNNMKTIGPTRYLGLKAMLLGLIASFFFAFTFVFNQVMTQAGGSWAWSASLRYLFMAPLLVAVVAVRGNLKPLLRDVGKSPQVWGLWGTVGFGVFYAPLTFAATFGPAWLVAGTWQITIIAGMLLLPYVQASQRSHPPRAKQIPLQALVISLIILLGIFFMQIAHMHALSANTAFLSIIPVGIAAFAYPLGNRKMMAICGNRFDSYQRVLGMTLGSIPFWLLISAYGIITAGWPLPSQILQSFIVAVSSGVIATILFYTATDLVKDNPHQLAAVEATQAGEVIFAVLGDIWWLSSPLPSGSAFVGIILVIIGMVLHSWFSATGQAVSDVAGGAPPVTGTFSRSDAEWPPHSLTRHQEPETPGADGKPHG